MNLYFIFLGFSVMGIILFLYGAKIRKSIYAIIFLAVYTALFFTLFSRKLIPLNPVTIVTGQFLTVVNPPLLLIHILTGLRRKFKLTPALILLIFSPPAVYSVFSFLYFMFPGVNSERILQEFAGAPTPINGPFFWSVYAMLLIYIIFNAVISVLFFYELKLRKEKLQIKMLINNIYFLNGSIFTAMVLLHVIEMMFNIADMPQASQIVPLFIGTLFLTFCLISIFSPLLLRHQIITRNQPDRSARIYRKTRLTESDIANLRTGLEEYIIGNKLFADPGMTAIKASGILKTHPLKFSEFMNGTMKIDFHSFLTRLRLEEAKRLMRENPDESIASVSIRSGFGSISTFYRVFSITEGMSPEKWRSTSGILG